MKLAEVKKAAINGILVRLTFDGAFQRARIYKKEVSGAQRKEFRKSMASLLPKFLNQIKKRKRYSHGDHYNTIEAFAKAVSKKHGNILDGNKLRLGNAQKFLNLYWKISWLLNRGTLKPIHCPFDSVIMKKLPRLVRIPWTQFDTIGEYKLLVKAVQAKIGVSLHAPELSFLILVSGAAPR